MKISFVVAIANNNAMGKDNQLLWHLPNDFKFFKNYTMGKVLLMGRKTFDSIGRRALPGRISAVVSRDASFSAANVEVFKTVEAALEHFKQAEEVCIIGGAEIFKQTLDIVDTLVITRVDANPAADVFFPDIDWNQWKLVSEEAHPADEKHAYKYTFQVFEKQ